jgi:hypothetical protein
MWTVVERCAARITRQRSPKNPKKQQKSGLVRDRRASSGSAAGKRFAPLRSPTHRQI